MTDTTFSKYKYIIGENLNTDKSKKFTGLELPIGNIEGNTITANTKWMAVSKNLNYSDNPCLL
jgi:WD40 repeat protein